MAVKEWSTSLPAGPDVKATAQQDLEEDSYEGAGDGDRALVSHIHTIRDIADYCAKQIGSNLEESGTLRERVTTLEAVVLDTENPILSYSSTSAINVLARPNRSTTIRITLQDGVQRSVTGTLAWSFSNGIADLGLDEGSEASSTWYYMYLVPNSGNDSLLTVRASDNAPATGPTGYTNFKYIGAFRNDASSNILSFSQIDNVFYYRSAKTPTAATSWSTTFQTPKIEISIDDLVPLTAGATFVVGILAQNATSTSSISQQFFTENETDPIAGVAMNDNNERVKHSIVIPLPGTASKKIGYRSYDAGAGGSIAVQNVNIASWIDEWILI